MPQHPGFSLDQLLAGNEHFIEYAYQHGIYAAGVSDVQGAAPKLLLAEHKNGSWHAEGVLPDAKVGAYWLLKKPRGNSHIDRQVLKNEAAYMQVAKQLGLTVHADLIWRDNLLFIPRFDRQVLETGAVMRLGLESLASVAGVAEYGARLSHDRLARCIIDYCSDPERDLLEYIKRDIANVILGNKDNHPRNTAVIRDADGIVALSPLYDFAPMYLDPEGIARVCRWDAPAEQAGQPIWGEVIAQYRNHLPDGNSLLRQFGENLARLPQIMKTVGVDYDIIDHRTPAIDENVRQLLDL